MIDFDKIDDWAPSLTRALEAQLPPDVAETLKRRAPEFVDDALSIIFESGKRNLIIDATLDWIRSTNIVAYHGSKLLEEDVVSIRTNGLIPLVATQRRDRLVRALSTHARWPKVEARLDYEIRAHSSGEHQGGREGQVHLTLSRAALVIDFNHYLSGGSEFDQNVAQALLGDDGPMLLARDGTATLVRVIVPGPEALTAAHPIFSIERVRRQGDLPNIVKEFLETWAYKLAHPTFQSSIHKPDCGLVFRNAVPPDWIWDIETDPTAN